MKNNIQDERVVNEGLKIYKISFYVLCIGIFFDLIIKFNLYSFVETAMETISAFFIETALLVTVFYLHIFLLAKKGIAACANQVNLDKFPKKRYATITAIISLIITFGLWTIRFCTGSWEYGIGNAVLFCALIYLVTFALSFVILFISFYLAFKVARNNQSIE